MRQAQQVLSEPMNDLEPYCYLFMALQANGAGYLVFFVCLMAEQETQHTGEMSDPKAKIQILAALIP